VNQTTSVWGREPEGQNAGAFQVTGNLGKTVTELLQGPEALLPFTLLSRSWDTRNPRCWQEVV
jgi:hypothetical protein